MVVVSVYGSPYVPLFIGYAPEVLHWITYIGAFTAFYAANWRIAQKRYQTCSPFSTISQVIYDCCIRAFVLP